MNKKISICLSFAFLMLLPGCKQKSEEATVSTTEETTYQPASPKLTAQYDRTKPTERIDVESAISTSSPIRLSEVASSIEYYQVGDDKYPVTEVIAVDGGFIALNKPKLYLYRQGEKRKRVGLKTQFSNWIDFPNISGNNLFYDKATTKLYVQLKRLNPETGYSTKYIAELPPLKNVLARTHYLYPDSLPNYSLGKNWAEAFTPEMYTQRFYYPETGFDYGVYTFNLKSDTLCRFYAGIDSFGVIPDKIFYNFTTYSTSYLYDNKITFTATYCDTVYRLLDHQTIAPVYAIHLGKYRAHATYVFNRGEKRNKAWMNEIRESPRGVFLKIHREGKSNKSGWLDTQDKQNQDFPSEDYLMVYLKEKRQTKALPLTAKGLINDLDEGIPFWPEGETDEYMYMIRSATELKKQIKLTGSPKQKALKKFLSDLPDNQNVMIVVK